MATRSTIAVRHEDGTVSQIYCHWDGYLSHNGMLLQNHYNTPLAVEFLVSKGDISSLGKRVGVKHPFSAVEGGIPSDEWDKNWGEMTTYYGRDRGENGTEPRKFDTVSDYIDGYQREEYNYYFNGETWEVEFDGDFISLAEAFELQAEE